MDDDNILKLAQIPGRADNLMKLAQMTRREGVFDDATGPAEWPEPDMSILGSESPEPPPFTDNLLPPAVARWVREMAAEIAAPPDYLAGSSLAYASAALGNARWVTPTGSSWEEPPQLWVALIGPPSAKKTPAQRSVVNAAASLEADDEPDFAETMQTYEREASRAKAVYDVWQGEIKTAVKNGSPAPDMPIDAIPPDMPVRPRLKVADSTREELGAILSGNPKGLLVIRDELTGWLGSMDQYGGHGSDRAFYLECWNGGAYIVDRRKHSGTPIRIPHASLSILGGIQPDRLKEALAGSDDGLASRFLFFWPKPAPFRALIVLTAEQETASRAQMDRLTAAGRRLRSLEMRPNEGGKLAPVMVKLEPAALELFNDINREADALAKSSRGLAAGWHGKTPARALRLALVFEFFAWALADDGTPAPTTISVRAMGHAGEFLDYAGLMLDRVLAGLLVEQADVDAVTIARLLVEERPTVINERKLYQRRGFHFLRTIDRRVSAFRVLEAAGFVRSKIAKVPGKPRGDWLVNPSLGAAR